VKYELEERGWSLSAIGRDIGLAKTTMAMVGRIPFPLAQARIAEIIGISPMAIWPSRYHPDGTPVARPEWLKARRLDQNGKPLPPKEVMAA
jgi:Ner family transcriptional regulator